MAATNIRGEQIKDSTVSLTVDVKDVLPVANGGSGSSTLSGAGIELTTNKGAANGYAGLNSSTVVDTAKLGSGSATSATFLRGDSSWAATPTTITTSVTSSTSVTLSAANPAYVSTNTGATTWTLPAVSGNTGAPFDLYNRGTAAVTVQRAGSDNLYQQGAATTTLSLPPGSAARLINDGTYWLVMSVYLPATLTFIGANAANATSITIPTHAVGDIIVIFAFAGANNSLPTKPSASGTVPAWVNIDSNATGTANCASTTVYFVATATTTTSGTWTNTDSMAVAVIRGQAASPLGGHANSGATYSTGAVAPSVTLTHTDGTSALLHFFGLRPTGSWTAFGVAPTGYVKQAGSSNGTWGGVCVETKTVTTTDGSVTQATADGSPSSQYRGATVEILAY